MKKLPDHRPFHCLMPIPTLARLHMLAEARQVSIGEIVREACAAALMAEYRANQPANGSAGN